MTPATVIILASVRIARGSILGAIAPLIATGTVIAIATVPTSQAIYSHLAVFLVGVGVSNGFSGDPEATQTNVFVVAFRFSIVVCGIEDDSRYGDWEKQLEGKRCDEDAAQLSGQIRREWIAQLVVWARNKR